MKNLNLIWIFGILFLFLSSFVSADAQCMIAGDVLINTEDTYPIGDPVDFSVYVTSNVASNSNVKIIPQLLKGTSVIQQSEVVFTDNDGNSPTITFTSPDEIGTFTIKAIVYYTNDLVHEYNKDIEIKPKIEVRPSVEASVSNQFPVKVKVDVYDIATNQKVTPGNIDATVTLNGVEVPVSKYTDRIEFTTTDTGLAKVWIKATKTGYISDETEISVSIRSPNEQYDVEVDGKSIVGREVIVDLGSNEINVEATLDGVSPLAMDNVVLTITDPYGKTETITATPNTDKNVWGGYYSFTEPGRSYDVKATIQKYGEEDKIVEFTVTTLGKEETGQVVSNNLYLIIGAVIGFAVLILVLFLVFRKKKKRR